MTVLVRCCLCVLACFAFTAWARQEFELVLKDHLFFPATLRVPAEQKIKIRLINSDNTPEEFESFALNREKVVLGNAEAVLYLGPLKPGEYDFFGDFNPDTAKGVIIAVPLAEWQSERADHVD